MAKINIPYCNGKNGRKLYFSVNTNNANPLQFLGSFNWITNDSFTGSNHDTSNLTSPDSVYTYGNILYLESGFSILFANTGAFKGSIILGNDRGEPIFTLTNSGHRTVKITTGATGDNSRYPIRTIVANSNIDYSNITYYTLFNAMTATNLYYAYFTDSLSGNSRYYIPTSDTSIVGSGNNIFFNPDGTIFKEMEVANSRVFLCYVLFNLSGTEYLNKFTQFVNVDPDNPGGDNPYEPGGDSGTGGGQGNFDDSSDPVPFSPLPSLSVTDSGFVGLFSPNIYQLKDLANYLWNNDLDLNQLRKLVANPIDLLISLTIVPVTPEISGEQSIKVGFIDTGIIVNKLSNQFISVNFGKVDVKNFYDSAIDYSPFTKISIYLPYIGLRNLNVDEIMGTTIELQYNIDLFTGACVAEIMVGNAVMYSFNGNVATQIPLFSESFDSAFSALIGLVSTMGMAVATSGASAAEGAASAGITGAQALSIGTSTLNAVMSAKPNVEHTGSMAGNIGFMGQKTPYLIYEIPRQSMPQYYQQYVGFPSNITAKLSDLTGFTVVSQIHLDNIPATTEELKEIESLLMGGVIL